MMVRESLGRFIRNATNFLRIKKWLKLAPPRLCSPAGTILGSKLWGNWEGGEVLHALVDYI